MMSVLQISFFEIKLFYHSHMDQIKDIIEGHHEHEEEAQRHEVAAICIQRAWRKRSRAKYLNSDTRWHDIALHARLRVCLPAICKRF